MLPIWKGIKRDVEKGIANSEDFFPRADFSESPYWVPLNTGSQWISKSFNRLPLIKMNIQIFYSLLQGSANPQPISM